MWGTLDEMIAKLGAVHPDLVGADLKLLTRAFGHTRFIHLSREDTAAQAVSWARAEQTNFWQHGDNPLPRHEPRFDFDQIHNLVQTIDEHNAAWQHWFSAFDVQPHLVRYENLTTDMSSAVHGILDFLGLPPLADRTLTPTHDRQADQLNNDWIARYHAIAG